MKLQSNKTAKLFKHLNCKKGVKKHQREIELLTETKAEIKPK